MNRYVRAAAAAAIAVGGAGSLGCVSTGAKSSDCGPAGCGAGAGGLRGYGGTKTPCWDPCWPERYSAVARAEVLAPFAAQVNNGHVLDQTIWNWYFEPGTDKLTAAGYAKLDSLAQVRPGPDPRLYLQAARDVSAAAAVGGVDTVAARREDLTARRAAAVQAYMNTQPAINPVAYEIFVHDPVVVGINAEFSERAFRGQAIGYRGGIGGGAGVNATSTGSGGPTPAASSIGTGTGGPSTGGTTGGASGAPSGPSGPSGGPGSGAPY